VSTHPISHTPEPIDERVDTLDWDELREQLDRQGHAITVPLLTAAECEELSALFDAGNFRATIDMVRHRFGDGRYRYFDHPLPDTIAALRTSFYRHLAPIANDWSRRLRGDSVTFPLAHGELIERCRAAGQERPTPLILRYGEGDWNALHQDLYGDVYFPFQILTILSEPGIDFDGGEFVLMEQRPRAQSRVHVLKPPRGAFVIFPTRQGPTRARTATTAWACATASPRSPAGSGRRWASSSTTRSSRRDDVEESGESVRTTALQSSAAAEGRRRVSGRSAYRLCSAMRARRSAARWRTTWNCG